jgi:hypothetical protein
MLILSNTMRACTNQTAAYKHADGKKIDGRRVLVDVERARTVKGWLPRRLGGGLGGTRRGGAEVNIKHSGREDNVREKERYRLEREREDRRVDERREFKIDLILILCDNNEFSFVQDLIRDEDLDRLRNHAKEEFALGLKRRKRRRSVEGTDRVRRITTDTKEETNLVRENAAGLDLEIRIGELIVAFEASQLD